MEHVLDVMGEALILVPIAFVSAGVTKMLVGEPVSIIMMPSLESVESPPVTMSSTSVNFAMPNNRPGLSTISGVLDYSPLHGTDLRSRTCGGIVSRSDE
ncbi:hypothetical protein A0W34_03175 [Rhodococcus sp. BH4]|nr:hypothetical protein A0W34_03175 [Rhodococcus sp. BH4]